MSSKSPSCFAMRLANLSMSVSAGSSAPGCTQKAVWQKSGRTWPRSCCTAGGTLELLQHLLGRTKTLPKASRSSMVESDSERRNGSGTDSKGLAPNSKEKRTTQVVANRLNKATRKRRKVHSKQDSTKPTYIPKVGVGTCSQAAGATVGSNSTIYRKKRQLPGRRSFEASLLQRRPGPALIAKRHNRIVTWAASAYSLTLLVVNYHHMTPKMTWVLSGFWCYSLS